MVCGYLHWNIKQWPDWLFLWLFEQSHYTGLDVLFADLTRWLVVGPRFPVHGNRTLKRSVFMPKQPAAISLLMSPRTDLHARLSSQLFQALPLFFPPFYSFFCWARRGLLVLLSVTRISSKVVRQKASHQFYTGLSCKRWSADVFLCRNYYFLDSLLYPPPLEKCSFAHNICLTEWKTCFLAPAGFPVTSAIMSLQTEIKIFPAFGSALT